VISKSWGDSVGEFQSPTLQGENSRSGLNWLKLLFYERGLSPNRKIIIYDQATMVLVLCFLFRDITFKEGRLLILSW
jgi:hypothetical protein